MVPRPIALLLVFFICLGCTAKTPAQAQASEPTRPNIIFIFTDDHASQSIGAYGSVINETPNIDRIAEEGVIFLNSFCGNSICGPSRATILTGLHSHANGFMNNTTRFDSTQQTFPQLLQDAGYNTAMIGKYHLWDNPVGFDDWMILPGQGEYYNPDFITPAGRQRVEGYVTDVITDLTLEWLENGRDSDAPFMVMTQHKAPHRTWMPGPNELDLYRGGNIPEPASLFEDLEERGPAAVQSEMTIRAHMFYAYDLYCPMDEGEALYEYYERKIGRLNEEQRAAWDAAFEPENEAFRAAFEDMTPDEVLRWQYQRYVGNYLRCIAGVDRNVGRILDYLDENPELKENTIIIYSSDQGFYLGEHGWYDKRWMYEESLAMPLVVRWPGVIEPGTEIEELVQNIDYAPTFLDIAGTEPETTMQGRSLLDLMRDDVEPWRDAIYYHYYEYHRHAHMVPPHYGIRTDRYSLMHFYHEDFGYWELYDLQEDPNQMHNVYEDPENAELIDELKERLEELRVQYNVEGEQAIQPEPKPEDAVEE